jgi:hypothetical protein
MENIYMPILHPFERAAQSPHAGLKQVIDAELDGLLDEMSSEFAALDVAIKAPPSV